MQCFWNISWVLRKEIYRSNHEGDKAENQPLLVLRVVAIFVGSIICLKSELALAEASASRIV